MAVSGMGIKDASILYCQKQELNGGVKKFKKQLTHLL
jgi:hypothetical protein